MLHLKQQATFGTEARPKTISIIVLISLRVDLAQIDSQGGGQTSLSVNPYPFILGS